MSAWLWSLALGPDAKRVAATWLRDHRPVQFALFGLSVAYSLAQLGLTLVLIRLVDAGLLDDNQSRFTEYLIALLMLCVALVVAGGAGSLYRQRHAARMLGALRENWVARILAAPLETVGGLRVGDVVSRIDADIARVQRFALDAPGALAGTVMRVIGGLGIVLWLDVWAGLATIVVGGLVGTFSRSFDDGRLDRRLRHRRAELASWLFETIHAAALIRTLGAAGRRLDELRALHDSFARDTGTAAWRRQLSRSVPQLTLFAARLGTLAYGGAQVLAGQLTPGELVALLLLVNLLLGPVLGWSGWHASRAAAEHSANRILALAPDTRGRSYARNESAPVAPEHRPCAAPSQTNPGERAFCLGFDNVSFRYSQTNAWVLRDLSFAVARGQRVLITGPSGAGKTTLCRLVPGLLAPLHGAVSLGSNVRVRVVPQNAQVLNGSLAYNLRMAMPDASDGQLMQVLRCVGLDSWVESLPTGLETGVADAGANLSGGQRQRLALARGLLTPYDLLVLDECLSEVGAEAAAEIARRLHEFSPGAAWMVVAHAHADAFGPFDQTVELRHPELGS